MAKKYKKKKISVNSLAWDWYGKKFKDLPKEEKQLIRWNVGKARK